jgi:hypothetical protein
MRSSSAQAGDNDLMLLGITTDQEEFSGMVSRWLVELELEGVTNMAAEGLSTSTPGIATKAEPAYIISSALTILDNSNSGTL